MRSGECFGECAVEKQQQTKLLSPFLICFFNLFGPCALYESNFLINCTTLIAPAASSLFPLDFKCIDLSIMLSPIYLLPLHTQLGPAQCPHTQNAHQKLAKRCSDDPPSPPRQCSISCRFFSSTDSLINHTPDVRILGFELKKDMAAKNVSHEANVRRPAVLAGQLTPRPLLEENLNNAWQETQIWRRSSFPSPNLYLC